MTVPFFRNMHSGDVTDEIDEYITFFNEERPAYALNYLTPKQYKEQAGMYNKQLINV